MQLQFLGQRYQANDMFVETPETGVTARFLGQSYPCRDAVSTQNLMNGKRTYRGVAY